MAQLTALCIHDDLERDRLEIRARQLERVLAILHGRAQAIEADGTERRGLRRASADFRHELDQIHVQLRAHQHRENPGRPAP